MCAQENRLIKTILLCTHAYLLVENLAFVLSSHKKAPLNGDGMLSSPMTYVFGEEIGENIFTTHFYLKA